MSFSRAIRRMIDEKPQVSFALEIKANNLKNIPENLELDGVFDCVKSDCPYIIPKSEIIEELVHKIQDYCTKYNFTDIEKVENTERKDLIIAKFRKSLSSYVGLSLFWLPVQNQISSKNQILALFLLFFILIDDDFIEILPFDEDTPDENKIYGEICWEVGLYFIESFRVGFTENEFKIDEEKYKKWPVLKKLNHFMKDFREMCISEIPDFEQIKNHWLIEMRRAFWGARNSFFVRKSMIEGDFREIRKDMSGVNTVFEMALLLQGIVPKEEHRLNEGYKQCLKSIENIVAFSNDLMGLVREFENGDRMNLIIFKWSNGVTLQKGIHQTCTFVNSEIDKFFESVYSLLNIYPDDQEILRMIKYAKIFIHGHTII